jgi:hypothetical protein
MTRFQSNRTFRLWDYHVSHDQLLLRSAKTESHPHNLDVVFVGVEYVRMPTHLKGLDIEPASPGEIMATGTEIGRTVAHPSQVYTVTSGRERYVIVAASVRTEQNDLDIFVSSVESFGR